MPIRFGKNSVTLEGACTVEEALPLLEYLQEHGKAKVAMRTCTHLHSAVLQVLMATRPTLSSVPEDEFLALWLVPALKGGRS